ncbi:MAG: DUF4013 domain-containing protein [Chloroflexota bacterium]|jgi:hypothetical protein
MDIGKAYTFIPEEEDWIKNIVIGGVLVLFSFLLIPIFFLIGYQVRVVKRVMDGDIHPLPEWDDWGQMFMDGLVVWVAQIVYALPVILLTLCSFFIWVPAATDPGGDIGAALSGAAIFGLVVLTCLVFLFAIALAFIMPALYIQYVRTGEFGPMFQIGEVIRIARENFVDILIVIVASIAAGFVLGLVTWIPICGWLILAPLGSIWIMIATAHLYGQIAAKTDGKEAEVAYAG